MSSAAGSAAASGSAPVLPLHPPAPSSHAPAVPAASAAAASNSSSAAAASDALAALEARGSLSDPTLKPDFVRIMDELDARRDTQTSEEMLAAVMLCPAMLQNQYYKIVFATESVNRALSQLRGIATDIGVNKQIADGCRNKAQVLQLIIAAIEAVAPKENEEDDDATQAHPPAPSARAAAAAASSNPARLMPSAAGLLRSQSNAVPSLQPRAAVGSSASARPLASGLGLDASAGIDTHAWAGLGVIDLADHNPADSDEQSDHEERKQSASAPKPRKSPRKSAVKSKSMAEVALAQNIAQLQLEASRREAAASRPRSGVSAEQVIAEAMELGSAAPPSHASAPKASSKAAPKSAHKLSFEGAAASKGKKRVDSPEPEEPPSSSSSEASDSDSDRSSSSEDDRRRKKSKRASKSKSKKDSKRNQRGKDKKRAKHSKRSKRRASPSSSSSSSDSSSSSSSDSDSDADPMLASLKGDTIPERIARTIWKRTPKGSFVYWVEHKGAATTWSWLQPSGSTAARLDAGKCRASNARVVLLQAIAENAPPLVSLFMLDRSSQFTV